jgi:hypothetical protein
MIFSDPSQLFSLLLREAALECRSIPDLELRPMQRENRAKVTHIRKLSTPSAERQFGLFEARVVRRIAR